MLACTSPEAHPPPVARPAVSDLPSPVTTPVVMPAGQTGAPVLETLAIAEGSALVALADGALLVAGDEDNRLYYVSNQRVITPLDLPLEVEASLSRDHKGTPVEIDLEALALATLSVASVDTPVVVVMGSHANKKVSEPDDLTKPVSRSPNRHLLFAIRVPAMGDRTTTLIGAPFRELAGLLLQRPAGATAALPGPAPDLSPNAGGLDIEGLTFAHGRLWFGLRSPIEAGLAYVASAPAELLLGAAPALSTLDAVDLGGRGVRSLDYADGRFVLVGGPTPRCIAGGEGLIDSAKQTDFGVYTWAPPAAPVRADVDLPEGFRAEGLALSSDAMWLLSDDARSPTNNACAKKRKGSASAKVSTLARFPPLPRP